MPVKHVINTDWVEVNLTSKNLSLFEGDVTTKKIEKRDKVLTQQRLKGPDKISIGKTIFKRVRNGNEFYRDAYNVFHRGKKFGYMLANSRDKKLLDIDNFQFKVFNNNLYEFGWLDHLQEVMHNTSCTYKSFTRLDIAIDGGKYFDVWHQWQAGTLDKVGRAAITTIQTGKKKFEGYYVGKGKSKKRVTCYNKTAELKRSNKWYVEKFWKRSGLIITKGEPVERCELKLRNEEGKKFKDIDWRRFDDFEHLASIMQSNLNNFYEWVIPSSGKNISRKKRFNPIDWDALGAEYLEKDSTRPTEELWAGKVACKKLIEIYIRTGKEFYRSMAYEIAHNLDAVAWINEREPIWKEDIEYKLSTGDAPQWITNFKEFDYNEQIILFDKQEMKELQTQQNLITNK